MRRKWSNNRKMKKRYLIKKQFVNRKNVRTCLERIYGKEIKKVLVSSKVKVVSFDLFDTLVIRNVPMPEDVFELVQIQYQREHPDGHLKLDFAALRRGAEKLARKKNAQNGKNEVTLEEIYDSIQELEESVRKELLKIEIETEYRVCQPNDEMKAFFEQMVKQGYSVIITSDMYLPESAVKNILKKCGYTSYTALYVSSKYGETKAAGTLFERIFSDFSIEKHQLLHIGDHIRSDYWIPKQKGMQAFLYRKRWKNPQFFRLLHGTKKQLSKAQLLQFQMLQRMMVHADVKKSQNERIGYEILGPLLLGYTMWLRNRTEKTDSLVFLAREGALLKRAFETLYPKEKKTHYVNVSRLAVCRASAAGAASWEELCRIFISVMRGVESIGDFLSLAGLAETDEGQLSQYHLKSSMHFDEEKEALFQYLKTYGQPYFEEQSALLKEYLRENGFAEKKAAISDIGWSGTMQKLLAQLMPDIELEGYYLAVSDFQKGADYGRCRRNGYFCDASEWERKGKMIRFSQSALESLFLGNEGTTLAYRRENGSVCPLKAKPENLGQGAQVIEAVQNAALCFLEDFRKADFPFFFEALDKQVAWEACFCFLTFPTKETVRFYKQLRFIDGMNRIAFVPQYPFLFYLFHPERAKKELEVNASKVLWLKGFFKIPFPYYRCLCFLTEQIGLKSSYRKKYFQ